MKGLNAVIEILRGLLVLSVTGLFLSLIFTAFWIYKRFDFSSSATETIHPSLANAYNQLGIQALMTAYGWILADILGLVLTTVFALILRHTLRMKRERQAAM